MERPANRSSRYWLTALAVDCRIKKRNAVRNKHERRFAILAFSTCVGHRLTSCNNSLCFPHHMWRLLRNRIRSLAHRWNSFRSRNPFRNCRLLQTHCNMAWHSLQNRNKRHPNRRRSPFRRKRNPYTYNQHHSMRMVRLGCLIRRCSWRRDHKPCRGKEPQHLEKTLSTSTLRFSN